MNQPHTSIQNFGPRLSLTFFTPRATDGGADRLVEDPAGPLFLC
jgi:hypothetical protein